MPSVYPAQHREKEQMRRLPMIIRAVPLLIILAYAVYATRHIGGLPSPTIGTAGSAPPVPANITAAKPTMAPRIALPSVSIDSVFAPDPPSFAGLDPRKLITIRTTGDVIPARMVNYEMTTRNDFTYPFLKTYKFTRAADLTLINLESPLIDDCPVTEQTMTFCGDPLAVQGLKLAGVDVANLPNNHIGNYGEQGIRATETLLTANHIAWDGFGHVVYKNLKGTIFAFLGFNGVGQDIDTAEMAREIRAAHKHADVVIVSFHWGLEYTPIPLTAPGIANQDPRMIGHLAVKAGADLVVGNHPHVIQGIEPYRGKFISYASGNFVFDQLLLGNPRTQEGVVGTYTFYGKTLISARYRPVLTEDYAQPHFISATLEAPILARMKAASLEIKKGYQR
jgi:poly-gamma-glutamate capsule biosynthesis protein CapA/YwtB (metallophosphatase superfamily)